MVKKINQLYLKVLHHLRSIIYFSYFFKLMVIPESFYSIIIYHDENGNYVCNWNIIFTIYISCVMTETEFRALYMLGNYSNIVIQSQPWNNSMSQAGLEPALLFSYSEIINIYLPLILSYNFGFISYALSCLQVWERIYLKHKQFQHIRSST